jgi:hypothetical protein
VVKQHKKRQKQRHKERQRERELKAEERVAIDQATCELLTLKYGNPLDARANLDRLMALHSNGDKPVTPSTVVRSVCTPYGVGLLRKIRADGTVVLNLNWGNRHHHDRSNGATKQISTALVRPSAASDGGSASRGASSSGAAALKSRHQTVMYVPPPYSAISEVETWEEYDEKRDWDKLRSQIPESTSLFEQLLAETKAAVVNR